MIKCRSTFKKVESQMSKSPCLLKKLLTPVCTQQLVNFIFHGSISLSKTKCIHHYWPQFSLKSGTKRCEKKHPNMAIRLNISANHVFFFPFLQWLHHWNICLSIWTICPDLLSDQHVCENFEGGHVICSHMNVNVIRSNK